MLETTTLNKTRKTEDTKGISGDMRPNLSPTGNFFYPKSTEFFKSYKLKNDDFTQGDVLNRGIFTTQLTQDLIKLEKKPKNPVVLNRIGLTYLQNGKPQKALKFFKRAYEYSPTFLNAAQNLARTYLILGKSKEAIAIYEKIINELTSSPLVLHEYSFVKIISGSYVDALRTLKKITPEFDRYYEVLNTIGLLYLLQSNLREAQIHFEKSRNTNPLYAHAWNNMGVVEEKYKNFSQAKELYSRAIELDPNYVAAHLNLFKLQAKDDLYIALHHISSVQHLVRFDAEILFKYAWTLMKLGRYEDAIKKYNQYLEIMPSNSSALNNLGHCYARLGNRDKGLNYFSLSNKADKSNPMPIRNLMIVLTDTHKYRQAKEIADQVIKSNPDDDAALYALGSYCHSVEDWDEARRYFKKAIKLRTDIDSVYANLGFIYTEIDKKYEEAIKVIRKRYKVGSRQFDVVNNLCHAYLRSGDAKSAKKYLRLLPLDYPVALATRGLYSLQLGFLDEAKEFYDRATQLTPTKYINDIMQYYHYDLALHYLQNNERDSAVNELKKCIALIGTKRYVVSDAKNILEQLN